MMFSRRSLPGRDEPIRLPSRHAVLGVPMAPPDPEGTRSIMFGMGCFWGAERYLWQVPGVVVTAVGYAGGETPNPTYEEVCTGRTGHAEVVRVVYRPDALSPLLTTFWEHHDPTQGNRQGNDVGTQYRSVILLPDAADLDEVLASRDRYQPALKAAGHGEITTEIRVDPVFYAAEEYHQQYLAKNPNGYCGIGGTGVACPTGVGA